MAKKPEEKDENPNSREETNRLELLAAGGLIAGVNTRISQAREAEEEREEKEKNALNYFLSPLQQLIAAAIEMRDATVNKTLDNAQSIREARKDLAPNTLELHKLDIDLGDFKRQTGIKSNRLIFEEKGEYYVYGQDGKKIVITDEKVLAAIKDSGLKPASGEAALKVDSLLRQQEAEMQRMMQQTMAAYELQKQQEAAQKNQPQAQRDSRIISNANSVTFDGDTKEEKPLKRTFAAAVAGPVIAPAPEFKPKPEQIFTLEA